MTNPSRRRLLQGGLVLAGLGLLSGCGLSLPWQRPKVPRIGYLGPSSGGFDAFRDGLRELGYVEGETIVIEARWAASTEQLPALAADLVSQPADVIVAASTTAVQAAMGATHTIPVVFPNIGDPVGSGFVASLARPGGNVTGLSDLSVQAAGRRLQLLREVVPGLSRVLSLRDTAIDEVNGGLGSRALQKAGQSLGVRIVKPVFREPTDLPAAFEMGVVEHAEAIVVNESPLVNGELGRIVELATAARLAVMSQNPPFVEAGGLISYGANVNGLFRRAAAFVDRILQGAKPADLPVEQATKFDFVINLKTAQALGITIPQSVLQQATEIIQ